MDKNIVPNCDTVLCIFEQCIVYTKSIFKIKINKYDHIIRLVN